MYRILCALSTTALLLGSRPAPASDLEDRLRSELRGAWAIVAVEIYSNCSGTYSDNEIGAAGVSSKAGRRFEPGELVKIDKVKLKRSRVDLLTALAEPVLTAYSDGPFELYEVKECRAQLIFDLARDTVKNGDAASVLDTVTGRLKVFPSRAAAEESGLWNGRERRPLPADYDLTLALHARWKAEQINASIAEAIEHAGDEADETVDDIDRDPEYLDGFAAGVEEMRSLSIDDCSRLVDASFRSWRDSPPSGKDTAWKRGYEDGQRLVFYLYLLRELQHCFVPVPEAPGP